MATYSHIAQGETSSLHHTYNYSVDLNVTKFKIFVCGKRHMQGTCITCKKILKEALSAVHSKSLLRRTNAIFILQFSPYSMTMLTISQE